MSEGGERECEREIRGGGGGGGRESKCGSCACAIHGHCLIVNVHCVHKLLKVHGCTCSAQIHVLLHVKYSCIYIPVVL